MNIEANRGSNRHTGSGLAAVRPHALDLGPITYDPRASEPKKGFGVTIGEVDTPTKPQPSKVIKGDSKHEIKPPVQQRF